MSHDCTAARIFDLGPTLIASLMIILSGCQKSASIAADTSSMDTILISFDTPSAGWSATPLEAWETDDEIICIFQLAPPSGMSAQVITPIQSAMLLPRSAKPKKRVVLGKSWNWTSDSEIQFPDSYAAFQSTLPDNAKRLEFQIPNAAHNKSHHVSPDVK